MHYLAECLLIRNENDYLLEHLEMGARAGIEFFYIYDHHSAPSVRDFLTTNAPQWLKRCSIEEFDARMDGTANFQLDCYRAFLYAHGREAKWCTFTDTDEIYTGDLRAACQTAEAEGYKSIRIKQVVHGANGEAWHRAGTMLKRFGADILKGYDMHKCIAQPEFIGIQRAHDTIFAYNDPHNVKEIDNKNGLVQLHHFPYRSLEEYIIKARRGGWERVRSYPLAAFDHYNSIDPQERARVLEKYGIYKH